MGNQCKEANVEDYFIVALLILFSNCCITWMWIFNLSYWSNILCCWSEGRGKTTIQLIQIIFFFFYKLY